MVELDLNQSEDQFGESTLKVNNKSIKRRNIIWDWIFISIRWFSMLSRELHWSFIFGLVVYHGINEGVGDALSSVGTNYYMKDVLKVQPSKAQLYQGIINTPWIVTPLWGILTDVVPIFGYRRRPYFILAGFLGVVTMLVISLHENLQIVWAILLLTIASGGEAIADVTMDACVAQKSISHPSLAHDMQSLAVVNSSIGSLLGYFISGLFIHHIGPMRVLSLMAITAGLVILVGFLLVEPPMHNFSYRQVNQTFINACKAVLATIKSKDVWMPCLYMFFSIALSLNIFEGMFYWYTDSKDGPSFSEESVGFMNSISSLGSLLGALLYQYALKNYPIRDMLFWTQLVYGFSGMLDLVLVKRWNIKFGIPDYFFIVMVESISRMIYRLKWLPMFVLGTKLCPSGIEGTFFALLMSIGDLGLFSSSWGGGILLNLLKVSRTRFGNLWLAILVRNILRILPLLMLFILVPKVDDSKSLIVTTSESLDSSKVDIGNSEPKKKVEFVSLVSSVEGK